MFMWFYRWSVVVARRDPYLTFKTSRHYVIYFNHMVFKVNYVVQCQSPGSRSTTGSSSRKPTLYSHFFMTSKLRLAAILDGPKMTPSSHHHHKSPLLDSIRSHFDTAHIFTCCFRKNPNNAVSHPRHTN
jgi:hypothetical protein